MNIPSVLVGALLALLLVAGLWAYTPDLARSDLEARYLGPSTTYRQIEGTSLRVRDTGASNAPVVLLIHGFGSSLDTWEAWARSLEEKHRVLRFDLPGSGLSEPDPTGDYTDTRSLALIKGLLDNLEVNRVVLIGHSLGGRLAWKFAAAYPDRVDRLVLIAPDGFASPGFGYGRAPQVPAVLKLMKYFLPKAVFRSNLEAAYADPARLGDDVVSRYYDLLRAPGNRGAMLARMQQTVLEDPTPSLRRIHAPTLLLWGQADHMIPVGNAADYRRLLSDVRLVTFPSLGHVPHEESPTDSIVPLIDFLAADRPGGSPTRPLAEPDDGQVPRDGTH